jgi:hypothetical protein
VAFAGVLAERLQRAAADTTLGRADRADERRVVVVVGQQAQVGGDVLDLGLVEERLAAGKQVGNALVAQELFERARLEVAAIEDRVIAERPRCSKRCACSFMTTARLPSRCPGRR